VKCNENRRSAPAVLLNSTQTKIALNMRNNFSERWNPTTKPTNHLSR